MTSLKPSRFSEESGIYIIDLSNLSSYQVSQGAPQQLRIIMTQAWTGCAGLSLSPNGKYLWVATSSKICTPHLIVH